MEPASDDSPYGTRKDPDPVPEKEHTERKPGRVPVVAYTRESPDDGDPKTSRHKVDVVQHTRRFPPSEVEDPPAPDGVIDLDTKYIARDKEGNYLLEDGAGRQFTATPDEVAKAVAGMGELRVAALMRLMQDAKEGFADRFLWNAVKEANGGDPIQTQINAWRTLFPPSVKAFGRFPHEDDLMEWVKPEVVERDDQGAVLCYSFSDASIFQIDGELKTLYALPNMDKDGNYNKDGPNQCTDLIGRYLRDILHLPVSNTHPGDNATVNALYNLGDGRSIVANMKNSGRQGKYGAYFEITEQGGVRSPMPGAIISTDGPLDEYGEQGPGHTAIIENMRVDDLDDRGNPTSLTAVLLEQNIGSKSGMSRNRTIQFEYRDGGWYSKGNKFSPSGGTDYAVLAWANPK